MNHAFDADQQRETTRPRWRAPRLALDAPAVTGLVGQDHPTHRFEDAWGLDARCTTGGVTMSRHTRLIDRARRVAVVATMATGLAGLTAGAAGTLAAAARTPLAAPPPITIPVSQADLQLTLSHFGSFTAGQTGDESIEVHNNGPLDAAGPITVTDTLPAGLSFDSVSSGGADWSCTPAGQVVTCTHPVTLTSGATSNFVLRAQVADAASSITNTARVASSTPDLIRSNNSASDPIAVNTLADLTLDASASPNPVVAGQPITYTFRVRNAGPSRTAGAIFSARLPLAGPASVVPSQGSCILGVGLVQCALATLRPGARATVSVVQTVPPAFGPGTLAMTGSVGSATTDPTTSNNSATASVKITALADLGLTLADGPDPVDAGQTVVYTLTARNSGPGAATGVTVHDILPAGATLASATASQGSCTASGGTVTCHLNTLAIGAAATASLQVVAPAEPGTLTDVASITSDAHDPNSANDSARAKTKVLAEADLSIRVSDTPDPVKAGQPLTYTLTVENEGPSTANSVAVTDTLPGGATNPAVTSSQGSCTPGGGSLTCAMGTLASGATATITVALTAPATAGIAADTATVSAIESDPNSANNKATERTTIR